MVTMMVMMFSVGDDRAGADRANCSPSKIANVVRRHDEIHLRVNKMTHTIHTLSRMTDGQTYVFRNLNAVAF